MKSLLIMFVTMVGLVGCASEAPEGQMTATCRDGTSHEVSDFNPCGFDETGANLAAKVYVDGVCIRGCDGTPIAEEECPLTCY